MEDLGVMADCQEEVATGKKFASFVPLGGQKFELLMRNVAAAFPIEDPGKIIGYLRIPSTSFWVKDSETSVSWLARNSSRNTVLARMYSSMFKLRQRSQGLITKRKQSRIDVIEA